MKKANHGLHRLHRLRWFIELLSLVMIALVLSACQLLFPIARADETVKIAYICKDLTNQWFVEVDKGLSKKCVELGIEYKAFDAKYNDEACLSAVDAAIDWGADAIGICTTNQVLGSRIARSCKNAAIPLITIDDTMADDTGKPLPHVGMPSYEIGVLGGTALARMAKERDFFGSGNIVKVLQIDVPTLSVIGERLNGYTDALMAATPLMKEDFIIVNSTSGMYDEDLVALNKVAMTLTEATHWLITGVNDDSAAACIDVLQQNGFSKNDILACGLGGYMVDEFKEGNRNYITIVTQPHREGEKAAEMLYKFIKEGVELSDLTVVGGKVATLDNYMMLIPSEAN